MDIILILTKDSYFVAYYDDEVDKVMNYQRVSLSDIEMIEFGICQSSFNIPGFKSQKSNHHSLRIHYRMPPTPSSVFFDGQNTVAVPPEPASLRDVS